MFVFYSALLYRVQENEVSLNISIWINIFELNSLLHRQHHSLHHFRLNIHQGFHILHVAIYHPHLLEKHLQLNGYLYKGPAHVVLCRVL